MSDETAPQTDTYLTYFEVKTINREVPYTEGSPSTVLPSVDYIYNKNTNTNEYVETDGKATVTFGESGNTIGTPEERKYVSLSFLTESTEPDTYYYYRINATTYPYIYEEDILDGLKLNPYEYNALGELVQVEGAESITFTLEGIVPVPPKGVSLVHESTGVRPANYIYDVLNSEMEDVIIYYKEDVEEVGLSLGLDGIVTSNPDTKDKFTMLDIYTEKEVVEEEEKVLTQMYTTTDEVIMLVGVTVVIAALTSSSWMDVFEVLRDYAGNLF
jgi:hypothetical protein